jgi:hypothetical protein
MLEEFAALLCACGYRILCEVRAEGQRLGFAMYLDDGPESEGRGQRVRLCPGCGDELGLHLLRAQKDLSP